MKLHYVLFCGFCLVSVCVVAAQKDSIADLNKESIIKQMMIQSSVQMNPSRNRMKRGIDNDDLHFLDQLVNTVRDSVAPAVSPYCGEDLTFYVQTLNEFAKAYQDFTKCATPVNTSDCLTCGAKAAQLPGMLWVFNVLDSMGKIPSGVLEMNNWFIGSYDECMSIEVKRSDGGELGTHYCLATVAVYTDYKGTQCNHTGGNNAWDPNICDAILMKLNYGMCLPKTCTNDDGVKIISVVLQSLEVGAENLQKSGGYVLSEQNKTCACAKVACHSAESHNMKYDHVAQFMLSFVILIMTIMFFATVYDYYIQKPDLDQIDGREQQKRANQTQPTVEPETPNFITEPSTPIAVSDGRPSRIIYVNVGSETKEQYKARQSELVKYLLCFSVYSNGMKLLDTTKQKNQVHCLHGMRFISMAWVILGHSYWWAFSHIDNLKRVYDLAPQVFNQIIFNATYSVDCFYVQSAFLLTYLWLKDAAKTEGKRIKNGKFWTMFYVHRYLRLTPVLAIILGLDVALFPYLGNGPVWSANGYEENYCAKGWWTNLLYLNNFLSLDEQCMSWTWYLANDFQFYALSPIFLVLIWYYEYIGVASILGTTVVTGFVRAWLVLDHTSPRWPPIFMATTDSAILTTEFQDSYWNNIYVKPYCRCGPYLMGMLLGYILFKTKCQRIKIPRTVVAIGWIVSVATLLGLLFGLYDYSANGRLPNVAATAAYAALCRPLWGAALCWIVFACVCGYGGPLNTFLSWGLWFPLGKLTYGAYMVHPFIIHYTYDTMKQMHHLDTHYSMIQYYVGHVLLSYALAFVISLAFEMPIMNIENLVFNPKKLAPSKPEESNGIATSATRTSHLSPEPQSPTATTSQGQQEQTYQFNSSMATPH